MTAVCLVHSPLDRGFALDLCKFLEAGCDVLCRPEDGLLEPGETIVARSEKLGLSGDILLIALSKASCAAGWPERKVWESVLITQARELGVEVVYFQLEDCTFPGVFKPHVFDGRENRAGAMRRLKRWFWARQSPASIVSAEFETVYQAVADQPGVIAVPGATAKRFAEEAAHEFAAVVWVPCHERSLAQILGHIGVELQMPLEGPVEENLHRVARVLEERRCLVVLDGISSALGNRLTTMGRSSTLITKDPVIRLETVDSYTAARQLVHAGRLAEAHEIFERLGDAKSLRDIAWILNAWGRVTEANAAHPELQPFAAQMSLFG